MVQKWRSGLCFGSVVIAMDITNFLSEFPISSFWGFSFFLSLWIEKPYVGNGIYVKYLKPFFRRRHLRRVQNVEPARSLPAPAG